MLTKDILFGMNVLTLAGFVVMGISLTLRRMKNAGAPLCIGLMRGNSSGIFRAVCGRLIKLAESGPPIPRHPYHKAATTIGGSNEIGLRTADTTTRL